MSLSYPHATQPVAPMPAAIRPAQRRTLRAMHHAVCEIVRQDGPDLSQRQLAVLMTLALSDGPHTVRGLAGALNVSKPAITRAMDRLTELGLAKRKEDPRDRRSPLLIIQPGGHLLLRKIDAALVEASVAP